MVRNTSFLSTILELYSKILLSQKPNGIEHKNVYTLLLRMTITLISQNTDLSSWNTLYIKNCHLSEGRLGIDVR
jgi:hypothetical protein